MSSTIVLCLVDLSGDYGTLKNALDNAIREMGPVYLFVNCAGMAICGKLEDNSSSDIMVYLIWSIGIILK